MARRNNMDISADILRLSIDGARKTSIVYKANLNFTLVEKYLKRLIENGLLRASDKLFITTPKGTRFIEQYRDLIDGTLCATLSA